jgi:hypothetical protein
MKIRSTEDSAVWRIFLPGARGCLSCSRNLYHLWSCNFHVLCPKLYPEPAESILKTSQNFSSISFIKLSLRQIEFQFVCSLELFRRNLCCSILNFRRYVEEICVLLSCYQDYIDNSLPTFGTNYPPHLQKARNPRPLKMELISCSETWVRNYSCTLRNNSEERRSRNLCLFHTPVALCICIPLHLL